MGKVTYGDFQFPSDFGFSGSSAGRADPRPAPKQSSNEFGDGLKRGGQPKCMAKGGPVKKAVGGILQNPIAQRAAINTASALQQPQQMAPLGAPQSGMKKGGAVKMAKGGPVKKGMGGTIRGGGLAGMTPIGMLANAATGENVSQYSPLSMAVEYSPVINGIKKLLGLKKGGEVKAKGGGKFIQGMHMKKGALHRQLGVPEGEKIPAKRLAQAAHSDNPLLAKRAHTAQMLKGLSKK